MISAADCITLAEAAAQLSMDLNYLRRTKVRDKHGLQEIRHPLCLDDRITFLSKASVEAAAAALVCTRELRARTKKMEPVCAGSILKNAQ